MADPILTYDPVNGWNDETVFVDTPSTEAITRGLFQRLFTQIQTFINSTYTSWITTTFATKSELSGVALGTVPDDSITNAKIATASKIGLLASLTTTIKTSIVDSINECVSNIALCLTTTAFNTIYDEDIGKIEYFAQSAVPTRRLECNGTAVSRTTYAKLFAKIGTTYGVGDGSTTFNLPDGRGVFLRGWDNGRGYDSGRAIGTYQADNNKTHTHTGTTATDGSHTHTVGIRASYGSLTNLSGGNDGTGTPTTLTTTGTGIHNHSFTTDSTGATETTVKNLAVLCCIKY